MNPFKAALHIQIFFALVIGAAIGLFFNPGEEHLEKNLTFSLKYEQGKVVVAEKDVDDQGNEVLVVPEVRLSAEEYSSRYPNLPKLESWKEAGKPPVIEVTKRHYRLIEDARSIHVTYCRDYNGRPVITTENVKTGKEVASKYPLFAQRYDLYRSSWSRRVTVISKTVGDIFLRLLKMVTIPLIVSSLITGIAGLGDAKRLGSMFGKTLAYYFVTSLLAITTGIIMVNLIRPGIGAILPGTGSVTTFGEQQSLGGVFLGMIDNMIPSNPVAALSNGDFLSIITFSILFGLFIVTAAEESRKRMTGFFQAFFDVMMGMTMFIIHLAPIGVLAFMAYATASQGPEIFGTLAWYMLTVFLALLVHATIVMPLILKFIAGRSPWAYAKALSPALMTAFSTASSNGTLPLTMTSVEKNAGVSNRVSSFVLPLGATINMDGTALYEAVAVLFIAQATTGFELSLGTQVIVAITALLASIGAAGIPHAGLVMMAIVLQAVGLPLEAQGIIIAVDRVLDMCRTTVNVWSDSCGCAVVERLTKQAT